MSCLQICHFDHATTWWLPGGLYSHHGYHHYRRFSPKSIPELTNQQGMGDKGWSDKKLCNLRFMAFREVFFPYTASLQRTSGDLSVGHKTSMSTIFGNVLPKVSTVNPMGMFKSYQRSNIIKIVIYDISGSYENDRILQGGVVYKIYFPDMPI